MLPVVFDTYSSRVPGTGVQLQSPSLTTSSVGRIAMTMAGTVPVFSDGGFSADLAPWAVDTVVPLSRSAARFFSATSRSAARSALSRGSTVHSDERDVAVSHPSNTCR